MRYFVLIPFISGLDCYRQAFRSWQPRERLNPFYFRAGLLPLMNMKDRYAES